MAMFQAIAYPFRRGPNGQFPLVVEDADAIKDHIRALILTTRGERVMRPSLGTRSLDFVFENNNKALEDAIRYDLAQTLARYESRITVVSISVLPDREAITLVITYTINATQRRDSLGLRME